jgi:hypothetical protein
MDFLKSYLYDGINEDNVYDNVIRFFIRLTDYLFWDYEYKIKCYNIISQLMTKIVFQNVEFINMQTLNDKINSSDSPRLREFFNKMIQNIKYETIINITNYTNSDILKNKYCMEDIVLAYVYTLFYEHEKYYDKYNNDLINTDSLKYAMIDNIFQQRTSLSFNVFISIHEEYLEKKYEMTKFAEYLFYDYYLICLIKFEKAVNRLSNIKNTSLCNKVLMIKENLYKHEIFDFNFKLCFNIYVNCYIDLIKNKTTYDKITQNFVMKIIELMRFEPHFKENLFMHVPYQNNMLQYNNEMMNDYYRFNLNIEPFDINYDNFYFILKHIDKIIKEYKLNYESNSENIKQLYNKLIQNIIYSDEIEKYGKPYMGGYSHYDLMFLNNFNSSVYSYKHIICKNNELLYGKIPDEKDFNIDLRDFFKCEKPVNYKTINFVIDDKIFIIHIIIYSINNDIHADVINIYNSVLSITTANLISKYINCNININNPAFLNGKYLEKYEQAYVILFIYIKLYYLINKNYNLQYQINYLNFYVKKYSYCLFTSFYLFLMFKLLSLSGSHNIDNVKRANLIDKYKLFLEKENINILPQNEKNKEDFIKNIDYLSNIFHIREHEYEENTLKKINIDEEHIKKTIYWLIHQKKEDYEYFNFLNKIFNVEYNNEQKYQILYFFLSSICLLLKNYSHQRETNNKKYHNLNDKYYYNILLSFCLFKNNCSNKIYIKDFIQYTITHNIRNKSFEDMINIFKKKINLFLNVDYFTFDNKKVKNDIINFDYNKDYEIFDIILSYMLYYTNLSDFAKKLSTNQNINIIQDDKLYYNTVKLSDRKEIIKLLNNSKPLSLFTLVNAKHIINHRKIDKLDENYKRLLTLNLLHTFSKDFLNYLIDERREYYNYDFDYFVEKYKEILRNPDPKLTIFDKNRAFIQEFITEVENTSEDNHHLMINYYDNEEIKKYQKFYNVNYMNLKKSNELSRNFDKIVNNYCDLFYDSITLEDITNKELYESTKKITFPLNNMKDVIKIDGSDIIFHNDYGDFYNSMLAENPEQRFKYNNCYIEIIEPLLKYYVHDLSSFIKKKYQSKIDKVLNTFFESNITKEFRTSTDFNVYINLSIVVSTDNTLSGKGHSCCIIISIKHGHGFIDIYNPHAHVATNSRVYVYNLILKLIANYFKNQHFKEILRRFCNCDIDGSSITIYESSDIQGNQIEIENKYNGYCVVINAIYAYSRIKFYNSSSYSMNYVQQQINNYLHKINHPILFFETFLFFLILNVYNENDCFDSFLIAGDYLKTMINCLGDDNRVKTHTIGSKIFKHPYFSKYKMNALLLIY